jgi:hypothetical protein
MLGDLNSGSQTNADYASTSPARCCLPRPRVLIGLGSRHRSAAKLLICLAVKGSLLDAYSHDIGIARGHDAVERSDDTRKIVFSASSEARDRNAPTNANQTRLQTSRIRQEHRPIRYLLPARLSFRQGQVNIMDGAPMRLPLRRPGTGDMVFPAIR